MNTPSPEAQESVGLRAQLLNRQSVLKEEIREALQDISGANPKELAGPVYDMKDESLGEMLRDVRLFDMRRDIQELLDIAAALQRMQAGNYGTCMDCGAPIPRARLRAYPTAKRCRPCQEMHERQGSMRPQRSA